MTGHMDDTHPNTTGLDITTGPYTGLACAWRITHWHREWNALLHPRFIWQWIRQGLPADRPVVMPGVVRRDGRPVLTAYGEHHAGQIAVDASTLKLADVTLSFAMCAPGVYRGDDIITAMVARFPIRVTMPDGSTEIARPREWKCTD